MAGVGNSSAPNSLSQGFDNHSNTNSSSSLNLNAPLRPSAPPDIQVIAATPLTEKKQARVLYDYDAADSSELSLLADELIVVYKLPGLDPDWLMAERGASKGKVPTTYLEVLK